MSEWMFFAGGLSLLACAGILIRAAVHAAHFEKCRGKGASGRKH